MAGVPTAGRGRRDREILLRKPCLGTRRGHLEQVSWRKGAAVRVLWLNPQRGSEKRRWGTRGDSLWAEAGTAGHRAVPGMAGATWSDWIPTALCQPGLARGGGLRQSSAWDGGGKKAPIGYSAPILCPGRF